MPQPADVAHDVLLRVAEFLRKLPAEQLDALATGEARLEVVARGGRATAATGAALPRPAQEIVATVAGIGDRAAARRYLEVDLKLTVAKLKQLAADLGITASGTKPKLLDAIVEWAVGRSLDSEAISRAGGAR
ncbi:MAG TPA: SAP domain-containing protein [Rugosimonospora sp.]|nr:SAP domain-containing protein [Rugosimonospora sp.]